VATIFFFIGEGTRVPVDNYRHYTISVIL